MREAVPLTRGLRIRANEQWQQQRATTLELSQDNTIRGKGVQMIKNSEGLRSKDIITTYQEATCRTALSFSLARCPSIANRFFRAPKTNLSSS